MSWVLVLPCAFAHFALCNWEATVNNTPTVSCVFLSQFLAEWKDQDLFDVTAWDTRLYQVVRIETPWTGAFSGGGFSGEAAQDL